MKPHKLLQKALASPVNVRFEEACTLARVFGFHLSRVSGSHHIFVHPSVRELLNLQDVRGKTVACILIFVLQPAWVKGVVPAGRPPVAEARFARIESLWVDRPPALFSQVRGESEAFRACVYKLDRRRLYRSGSLNSSLTPGGHCEQERFAGIEVSLEELLVALRREEQTLPLKPFPNTPEAHRAVVRIPGSPGPPGASLSGGDRGLRAGRGLLLHQRPGVEVMVANPRAVRHFAQALMERSKTDPLDARVLLEFAERMPFQLWQPPSATARHLCALARPSRR